MPHDRDEATADKGSKKRNPTPNGQIDVSHNAELDEALPLLIGKEEVKDTHPDIPHLRCPCPIKPRVQRDLENRSTNNANETDI